ncbi:LysE family translocator [Jannaschia pohangensis]|uniref:Threonine/homoserine/homoserine lactone efflux protein n=1 Tax=Jannaschia pohangensis TaxID=390807 RepID=A0A1I3SKM5_9RHOB|nr:LysE family translocator [Jannaschia pohangensis]SFJ57996.1 Threonine/homoserine/homoserine lactone efflux protein [Jannaschia pohangensis]
MLTFAAAVFFLIVTPGPGVLSTAGVGSAFGLRPGLRYVAGLCIGTNLVALAVITGIAAVIFAHPAIRLVLLAASTGYLLYLAYRIATAGANVAFTAAARPLGLRDGLALQAINPKAYAVNTTLFSGFSFLPDAAVAEAVLKLLIMNAIWVPIHIGWLLAGIWLHRLALAPEVQRRINIAMAASLLAVVALALFSLRG